MHSFEDLIDQCRQLAHKNLLGDVVGQQDEDYRSEVVMHAANKVTPPLEDIDLAWFGAMLESRPELLTSDFYAKESNVQRLMREVVIDAISEALDPEFDAVYLPGLRM